MITIRGLGITIEVTSSQRGFGSHDIMLETVVPRSETGTTYPKDRLSIKRASESHGAGRSDYLLEHHYKRPAEIPSP